MQKLLALEKSDPTSLSELLTNNKTRDALNNLLKDQPTPLSSVENKKMASESPMELDQENLSTLFESSEDKKPKVDAPSNGQKSSSLAQLLLRLDKSDLENLG